MRLLNEKVNFWLCFCCPKCRLFAFVLRFEAFREERERDTSESRGRVPKGESREISFVYTWNILEYGSSQKFDSNTQGLCFVTLLRGSPVLRHRGEVLANLRGLSETFQSSWEESFSELQSWT